MPALLAVLAVAGHAGAVSAAQYCVADAAQLRSAITAVSGASGAASNEIRILAGTHNVAVGASGDYALSLTLNTAPLTITGGWNAGCTQRNLIADASIISGNIPSGLRIETDVDSAAEIDLDRTSFRNCRASGSVTGPALAVILRDSFLRIRSSVFTDNAGAVGTISMSNLGGTIYFTANTVA